MPDRVSRQPPSSLFRHQPPPEWVWRWWVDDGQPLPEGGVLWDRCDQVYDDGAQCTGAALSGYARCLVHLTNTELESVMTPRPDEAPPRLDARGVRLTTGNLKRVLSAARRHGFPLRLRDVWFDRATVEGDVSLRAATVEGDVSLRGATVQGGVSLYAARVQGDVSLDGATVQGDVYVYDATVQGGVSLYNAMVDGDVSFRSARVQGDVFLGDATVQGGVSLHDATVQGGVSLYDAQVQGDLSLRGATVNGEALLVGSSLGWEGSMVLSDARLLGGLTAHVGESEVVMERVKVQGPAVLAARATGAVFPPPRLLRLAGSDVASLTLTGVNLYACHFSGAINLDKLHIDGSPLLAERGGWWRARRRVLAEEHVWRHLHGSSRRRSGWYPEECRPVSDPEGLEILETPRLAPREIAEVYRALRKGREDSKDEPGAADFYYGEMEMRRKAAGRGVEAMLLTAYWLLSGYGLRAWRALTALLVLIAAATILFATVGLGRTSVTLYRPIPARDAGTPSYQITSIPGPRPGWATALDYAVQSATSLLRSPQSPPPLTSAGKVLEIFLRFAGPGLLALAVLALRGRVKR